MYIFPLENSKSQKGPIKNLKIFMVSRAGFSQEDPNTSPGAGKILCGGQRRKIAIFVVEIFFY
jgi:hypothetical protein